MSLISLINRYDKVIHITWDLRELTYELPITNILDKNDPQISTYTLNDREYYAHTHVFFFYIYTNIHTLNMNK